MDRTSSDSTAAKSARNYTVPAVQRTIIILDALSRNPRGMALAGLAAKTGIPKSSLFRILSTLVEYGLVLLDHDKQVYCLGMRLYEWGSLALDRLDFKAIAHPHLVQLAAETGQSFYLAVLEDHEVILVDRADTPDIWRIVTRIGLRSPVHCTASGLALISDFSDEQIEEIIAVKGLKRYTAKTITSKEGLLEKVREVRRKGYAIADGDYKNDLFAVAVPLRNHDGSIIASLMAGLHTETAHRDKELVRSVVRLVVDAGLEISRRLGYKQRSR